MKQDNGLVTKRSDVMMVVEVKRGNPNGDPDTGGAPREIEGGFGIISDKTIKRKCRDIWEDHSNPVFTEIAEKVGVPSKDYGFYEVLESMTKGFDAENPIDAKNELKKLCQKDTQEACRKYIDVRTFGCTFLDEQGEKGKKVRFTRSGVVQVGYAMSIAPIQVTMQTLTRKANTEDKKSDGGGMGPDGIKFVNHGIYTVRLSVNPFYASKTETTTRDIEFLKATLPYIFSVTESTARPAGSINIRHIWWADHTSALGSFDANALFSKLMPVKKTDKNLPSMGGDEYEFPVYGKNGINLVDLMVK